MGFSTDSRERSSDNQIHVQKWAVAKFCKLLQIAAVVMNVPLEVAVCLCACARVCVWLCACARVCVVVVCVRARVCGGCVCARTCVW